MCLEVVSLLNAVNNSVNEEDESQTEEEEDIEHPRMEPLQFISPTSSLPLISQSASQNQPFVSAERFDQLQQQMDSLRELQLQQMQAQQSFNASILQGLITSIK